MEDAEVEGVSSVDLGNSSHGDGDHRINASDRVMDGGDNGDRDTIGGGGDEVDFEGCDDRVHSHHCD